MEDRYAKMSADELVEEMDAWLGVIRMTKGPGGPSNAARDASEQQLALVEAWYHLKKGEA